MIEKIGPIKNPLTIIAIFAAIAEISGTMVLPFIDKGNQSVYVWFLMVFPILLIVLFFLTLNFNHRVLYAPSDYQNEDNFLQSLPRASYTEKVQKIQAEIAETEATEAPLAEMGQAVQQGSESSTASTPETISYQTLVRRSAQASYMLAEELIFRKLASEFSSDIQREVKIGSVARRYIFDGIVRDKGATTIIEVKYSRSGFMPGVHIREIFSRIQEGVKLLPQEQISGLRVLLAIAADDITKINQEKVHAQSEQYRGEFRFPIEVRFYSLTDLEREFNIGD